ncbi:hypothetical protein [Pseudomonas aeruginosa]|uniref:hypothetical protein n=1 Tax=Pseudomonas aeruginosa TaxID=287 RepID=UPI001930EAE5|nr:hypothetical protein [Pseudomonas aeruginosa]EKX8761087.1 hypothetical protein [Pseudomonas aeruginosa]
MADKNCSMCGGKGYYCEHSTVETCWCVKPTAEDDVIEIKAEAERTKDLARIANMLREDAEVFSSCDYEVEHYDKAADGIEWLIAEVEHLRRFAAEAYQVLGALDAPENVLDNASDAANGVPLRHETLLPFFAEDYEALRKDAVRYRWLRDSCTRQWDVMYRDIEIVINGDGADDCEDLDGIIDAALEGATQ